MISLFFVTLSPTTPDDRKEEKASQQQILDSYRQFPHANTGCVVDSVCDRCSNAGQPDLTDSTRADFC